MHFIIWEAAAALLLVLVVLSVIGQTLEDLSYKVSKWILHRGKNYE